MVETLFNSEYSSYGYSANCYLISSGNEAAVVDPSCESRVIVSAINARGLTLKYILLTHGHFDHIHSLDDLKNYSGAEVCIHKNDAEMLTSAHKSLYVSFEGRDITFDPADKLLEDGEELNLGGEIIKVIHTPGHTKGSVVYLVGNDLLTGDTLFDMSVGRWDFPGGDATELLHSIKKIYSHHIECNIFPGHGKTSTVAKQKANNPFTRGI